MFSGTRAPSSQIPHQPVRSLSTQHLPFDISIDESETVGRNMKDPSHLPLPRPFLDLPPEVRNNIYEQLFGSGVQYDIDQQGDHEEEEASGGTGVDSFCTCRQIHREAAGIFYSDNEFWVTGSTTREKASDVISFAAEWLKELGQHARLVKQRHLDCSGVCIPPCCMVGDQIDVLPLLQHKHNELDFFFHKDYYSG